MKHVEVLLNARTINPRTKLARVRYLKATGRGIVAVKMLHLAGLTNLVDAQKSVRDLA